MNDSTQEQQATESSATSFGEKIRQAREARQLSIDDLVGETRIHPQHLVDLEQGKTSGISATGYVIGYLRTLAKILDLDAEVLISDYKSSTNQTDHQTIDPEHELLPVQRKKNSLGWHTVLATTIIAIAGLGTVGYYWWENMNDGTSETEQSEIDEEVSNVEEPTQVHQPTTGEQNGTLSSGSASGYLGSESEAEGGDDETLSANGDFDSTREDESSNLNSSDPPSTHTNMNWVDLMNLTRELPIDVTNDEDSEPIDQTGNSDIESDFETEEGEQTEEPVSDEPSLLFEFSEISYVEVTDADDNQLVSDTKQAGTTLELDGKAPFTVKLGFAPGVTVFYNGDKVDLNPYTRRNIAEFKLPP